MLLPLFLSNGSELTSRSILLHCPTGFSRCILDYLSGVTYSLLLRRRWFYVFIGIILGIDGYCVRYGRAQFSAETLDRRGSSIRNEVNV